MTRGNVECPQAAPAASCPSINFRVRRAAQPSYPARNLNPQTSHPPPLVERRKTQTESPVADLNSTPQRLPPLFIHPYILLEKRYDRAQAERFQPPPVWLLAFSRPEESLHYLLRGFWLLFTLFIRSGWFGFFSSFCCSCGCGQEGSTYQGEDRHKAEAQQEDG